MSPKRRPKPPQRRLPYRRFLIRVLLLLLPAALVWMLVTPYYNRLLASSAETLTRLFENPRVTRLHRHDAHHVLVTRLDHPGHGASGSVGSVRVTDIHFPLIFLVALFLAVPGLPTRLRSRQLALALAVSVLFHLLTLVFWIQFIYATQLGDWSLQHYGVLARNFWGLGKHLLDLPFKLALPLGLWCFFYLPMLLSPAVTKQR